MAWNYRKYNAHKVEIDGRTFDSIKESRRYQELKLLEQAGAIHDLQCQVKFNLIPAQREPDRIGKRGGKIKGKTIEREVNYIADFTYYEGDEFVVEDVKGYKGGSAYEIFKLKRKMMLYFHQIRIREV